MRRVLTCLLLFVAPGGCGGYYTLTVGDHVGAVGEEVPVVARLQRNDFFVLNFPVEKAAIRFRIADAPERVSHTDENGYAGTTVPAPPSPGRYTLHVDNADSEGEETARERPIFLWDPTRDLIAVEVDALDEGHSRDAGDAAAALRRLAENANIVYLTRRPMRKHDQMRRRLTVGRYPDGAILLWQRERWRIVRAGRWRRIVVETRLISQLPELRKMFPKLSVGVCTSKIAARAFAAAGMRVLVVGNVSVDVPKRVRRNSWADLAKRGI